MRRRRPRMTAEALKSLLKRHGKEIAEEAEAEESAKERASASASTNDSASGQNANKK